MQSIEIVSVTRRDMYCGGAANTDRGYADIGWGEGGANREYV